MLRMAVLDRIRRWFCYVFIRGDKERSEGGQSIIGDISDSFKPKTLWLTDSDHSDP